MNRQLILNDSGIQVNGSMAAARILYNELRNLDHEESWALYMNSKNMPIQAEMITCGTLDSTYMDNRRVIKEALLCDAKSIIIYHNHPSGVPEPGTADIESTDTLRKCCELFSLSLLDHIIFGKQSYFSFADAQKHQIR